MDTYEEIYMEFVGTGEVDSKNIFILMQYLQKHKECEFHMSYCGDLPFLNKDGFIVTISVGSETSVMACAALLEAAVRSVLLKLRETILL